MSRFSIFSLVLILAPAAMASDDPKPKVIPASEAKDHLDKPCIVEMTVRLSKNADKRMEYYLDSEADYHDPKNVAVVIGYDVIDAFKKAGIDDPSKHYLDKKIRVEGTPKLDAKQVKMRIVDPKFITIVESK